MPSFEQINNEQVGDSNNTESVLSSIFPLADVPEPPDYQVDFQFQGFNLDAAVQEKLADFQYVSVSFTSIDENNNFILKGTSIISPIDEDSLIQYYNDAKIQSELISANKVSSIYFQDNFSTDTASQVIEDVASGLDVDITQLSLSSAASSILSSVLFTIGGEGNLNAGVAVDTNISDDIVNAMLLEQSFRNDSDIESFETELSILGKVSEKSHALFFDDRIINDVMLAGSKSQFGAFSAPMGADATSVALGSPLVLQGIARNNYNAGQIDGEDFEFVVNPVINSLADEGKISEVKIAGYMIEKFEILPDGTQVEMEPYIISALDVTPGTTVTLQDPEITLGNLYSYVLSTIAIYKIRDVGNLVTGVLEDIEVLIKSRPQTATLIAGTRFPDAPTDINYSYDQQNGNLLITWDFPSSDTTSFIKKFQIFRRESVDVPFTLIRQYDFDDSENPVDPIEDVDFGLNVKIGEPLTFYIDEEFKKDKEYIYAICAVSQEGASSQYSVQTSVKYSNAERKLILRKISESGAPKPYPNFYIDQELDVDIMKVSESSVMTVYMDPDVFNLKVPGDENNDGVVDPDETEAIQFVRTNRTGGKYIMQLINTDLLKEQRFEITIDDPSTLIDDLSGP